MNTTTIKGANGTTLFYESDTQLANSAKLLLLHGYGEHSGRSVDFLNQAAQQGLDTYRYDHQGHGKSEGRMAYINRFQDYVDDLKIVISQLPDDGKPLFIFSHSMGGLILTKYLIDHGHEGIKGVVFSAPAVMIPADLSPFLQKISGVMSVILPKLQTVKLDTQWLCRDNEVVADYLEDPLVYHEGAYARTGSEMIKTQKWTQQHFDKIKVPFLLLHGSDDKLAEPKGSEQLYEKASSNDKEFHRYKDYYHELIFEPGKEQIITKILDWIKTRIK